MSLTLFFQNKWIGLLHHVCDVHEWTGEQCDRGDLGPDEQHPRWFDCRDCQDYVEISQASLARMVHRGWALFRKTLWDEKKEKHKVSKFFVNLCEFKFIQF